MLRLARWTVSTLIVFGLLIMAGLAFVTILPAGRLPDYKPGDIPTDPPSARAEPEA